MLGKLRGMFALAIWDALGRRLVLARDPYGIKPLYVVEQDGWLQFASQVKALGREGAWGVSSTRRPWWAFCSGSSVPEPRTIRKAVRAVPAGHVLVVEDGRVEPARTPSAICAIDSAPCADIAEALADSVRAHLVADVPVTAVFLSAGIDSSVIAARAARGRRTVDDADDAICRFRGNDRR